VPDGLGGEDGVGHGEDVVFVFVVGIGEVHVYGEFGVLDHFGDGAVRAACDACLLRGA